MKPNGRDHTTDPVLKRLAGLDHYALIFARHLQARGPDEVVCDDSPPVPSDPSSGISGSPGPTQIAGDRPGEVEKQLEQVAEQPEQVAEQLKEVTKQLEGLVGPEQQSRGEPKHQGEAATLPVVHLPVPLPLPVIPSPASLPSPIPSPRPLLPPGPSGTTADRKMELLPASTVEKNAAPNEAKPPLHPVGATSNPVTSAMQLSQQGEEKEEPTRNGGDDDSEFSKARTSWWRRLCCK